MHFSRSARTMRIWPTFRLAETDKQRLVHTLISNTYRDLNKTVLLRDTIHQISQWESGAAGLTAGQPWPLTPWVKTTKFNQYLSVVLTSLSMSIARFQKPVMFWIWHRGAALWCHGCGAWHNGLFPNTASKVNYWADSIVARGWCRKLSNATSVTSQAGFGPYHGLKLSNHGIKG